MNKTQMSISPMVDLENKNSQNNSTNSMQQRENVSDLAPRANALKQKLVAPIVGAILTVAAPSIDGNISAQTTHTDNQDNQKEKTETVTANTNTQEHDAQTLHFGQRWLEKHGGNDMDIHICDETCAPKAYTEEEWEQKQREMEEQATSRSDEVERTDEWFDEEDLLEPFIMNAYITYYRELHDLLPNGPADSIALQEALIQNLHAINEVFYNTGMTPTPETPVFNVVGIESVPGLLFDNPPNGSLAGFQTLENLVSNPELREKIQCTKATYLVYRGDFSAETGVPGATRSGLRSSGGQPAQSIGLEGISVMNFRRGHTDRLGSIAHNNRSRLHNHETGHHVGVGHDTGGPWETQARAGEIMRIPTQSTLPDMAYLSGTACANESEWPTFARLLYTQGSTKYGEGEQSERDNWETVKNRVEQTQFTPLSLTLSAQQIDGEPIDLHTDMPVELTTADTIIFNGTTNRGDELETDQIEHTRYLQDEDGNVIATHTGQTYEFNHDTPGNYTIEHRANQGCYDKMDTIHVLIEQATNTTFQPTLEKGLRVYPNPTDGTITLDAHPELIQHITQYEIFNMVGQSVRQETFTGQEINIADLPTGIYIMQVTTPTEHVGIQIVKK